MLAITNWRVKGNTFNVLSSPPLPTLLYNPYYITSALFCPTLNLKENQSYSIILV